MKSLPQIARLFALLLVITLSTMLASEVHAQRRIVIGEDRPSMQRALDRLTLVLDQTDRRIEQMDQLLGPGADSHSLSELTTAREIQEHARDAFAQGQPRVALRLTMEAREHIQQAGAVSRGLPDSERVSIQLERTRDLIGRSRERLSSCDRPEAHEAIDAADMLQSRADSALIEGRSLAAQELSLQARGRAFRALQSCNLGEDLPGTATFALKRTDQVLARARGNAPTSPSAQQSLDEAARLQARAQQEFRQQHVDESLKLTHSARAAARRAVGQPHPR